MRGIVPPIYRRVRVPDGFTLHQLHRVLQIAFSRLDYHLYDFGDSWTHDIEVEALLPMPSPNGPDWSPRLLDGRRAAPPEDSGGTTGYERIRAVLRDPTHPEYAEVREWAGSTYDPERFDPWATDHALALAVAWGAI
jgi:hypothetical protein